MLFLDPRLSVFIRGSIVFFVFAAVLPGRVLAAQAASTPGANDELRAAFEKAQDYFKQKKYKEAKDILNPLVAKASPMEDFVPKARLLLANLQEDFTVSIAQFQTLATEYSNRPEGEEAQKNLGSRYYLADKYDDAANSYKEFLDHYPKSSSLPEVHYWYASSLLALDKNNEAVDEYRRVLDNAPDSSWAPKSLLGMGNAYFKLKKYGDAEKQYLKILDQYHLYDELNLVYLKLGQSYEAEAKYKEAHAAYQTLIQQYPKAFEVSEAGDRLRALESQHKELPHAVEAEAPEPTPTPVVLARPTPTEVVPVLTEENSDEAPAGSISKPFHVQVGVYSKKFNVDKTRKLIKKAGYKSYVVTAKQEGVPYTYYKVRVGNFADRPTAEKVAKKLARETKEKAIVVED